MPAIVDIALTDDQTNPDLSRERGISLTQIENQKLNEFINQNIKSRYGASILNKKFYTETGIKFTNRTIYYRFKKYKQNHPSTQLSNELKRSITRAPYQESLALNLPTLLTLNSPKEDYLRKTDLYTPPRQLIEKYIHTKKLNTDPVLKTANLVQDSLLDFTTPQAIPPINNPNQSMKKKQHRKEIEKIHEQQTDSQPTKILKSVSITNIAIDPIPCLPLYTEIIDLSEQINQRERSMTHK